MLVKDGQLQETLSEVVWPEALPDNRGVSAVLIPLLYNPITAADEILLIKRAGGGYHQKQIAFPGGHVESDDVDSWCTACRETFEETGIVLDSMLALGRLPLEKTIRDVLVFPWVARVASTVSASELRLNAREVERVLFLPVERLVREGVPFIESPGPFRGESVGLTVDGELVWGLTARLLKELAGRLRNPGCCSGSGQ